jgi:hypothetical protein
MDLGDLWAEIGRELNDPNNDRWSQAVLTDRANIVATQILGYTNSVKTRESLTPVAGTETVSVDSDTMDIIRVDIKNSSGEWVKLQGILRDQLDFEDPNWQQRDDGRPIRYWWDGTNQQLNLVPAPSSEWAQTDGLRVWEVRKPADMDTTDDIPFDSNAAMIPYHMAIVHGVVSLCWMDDATPEAMQKSRFHRSGLMDRPGNFERELKRILAKFDAPEDIPARILWRPQGGRASGRGLRSKSNPLGI